MQNINTQAKNWFITGSNSGFGLALTKAVLGKGDCVIATSRHPEELDDLVQKYPDTIKVVQLDVTKSEDIAKAVYTAQQTNGGIDVLVNNAGFGTLGAVEEVAEDKIRFLMQSLMGETPKTALHRYQFEVNYFGTLNLTRAFLPHFRQQGSGHILNVSSVGGFTSYAGTGIYSSSKFAIEGMSEALSQELAPLGVKVTIVEPGAFRTGFSGSALSVPENQISDYSETSGKFVKMAQSIDKEEPGDPHKAALAMIKVVESDNPPLRLVLGEDALEGILKNLLL
ncbi:MAG: SDR family NAD(P)-dependent oxidoreductase [Cyanobacteria bacterium P01_E01_bin.35]